ncbi:hypothetical protein D3C78_552850 [compost metagenome]
MAEYWKDLAERHAVELANTRGRLYKERARAITYRAAALLGWVVVVALSAAELMQ